MLNCFCIHKWFQSRRLKIPPWYVHICLCIYVLMSLLRFWKLILKGHLRGRECPIIPLLQYGVPPTEDSPPWTSPMSCPWYVIHKSEWGVTSPARTSTGSSLYRATDSARILFQSRLIDSIKHLPAPENLQSLWVDIFSSVYLHGLQRHSCLPMGCPRAAGESLLWLPEPSCPSSFTDPGGSAELFLPYILTPPYSPEAFTVAQLSFPFLNASSQK